MKVYQAIAGAVASRVETLFGLTGDANLFLVDSFCRDHHGTFVSAANELGSVLMASGYSSTSGKVGVATVTHGPAFTNIVTALVEGVRAGLPSVVLVGDTPATAEEHLQDIDQREITAASGAGFVQFRSPQTLYRDLGTAFRRARQERRPIVFNMPADFQWEEIEAGALPPDTLPARGRPEPGEDWDNALGLIASARRPIILAGRGAIDDRSKAALIALARHLEAPLATTLKANGLFRDEPFNLDFFGSLSSPATLDAITSSDCIVAFGASLNRFTTDRRALLSGKRLVHVDSAPANIGKFCQPTVGLVGDCAATAEAMLETLREAGLPASGFASDDLREAIRADQLPARLHPDGDGTVDIRSALMQLAGACPADRIVITDAGRFEWQAWLCVRPPHPSDFMHTANFGSIGLGLATAIGAYFGGGRRPTVMVTGDGGFMNGGLTELNTAVRHDVDLTVLICNDSAYGAEQSLFADRRMDAGLATIPWPDFAPVADALGGRGLTVRSQKDLDAAAAAIAGKDGGVMLIDVKIDVGKVPKLH